MERLNSFVGVMTHARHFFGMGVGQPLLILAGHDPLMGDLFTQRTCFGARLGSDFGQLLAYAGQFAFHGLGTIARALRGPAGRATDAR